MSLPDPDTLTLAMTPYLAPGSAFEGDTYARLNALRDWANATLGPHGFELYLEDVWNERKQGETWFEYILRSRHTKDETDPIGYDVYKNHQDDKGVWHLDEYTHSVILMPDPAPLLAFIVQNALKS